MVAMFTQIAAPGSRAASSLEQAVDMAGDMVQTRALVQFFSDIRQQLFNDRLAAYRKG